MSHTGMLQRTCQRTLPDFSDIEIYFQKYYNAYLNININYQPSKQGMTFIQNIITSN